MKKEIKLPLKYASFLKIIISDVMKAKDDADVMKKYAFFQSVKDLEMGDTDEEVTLEFDKDVVDWLESKWSLVPGEYKVYNKEGELLREGLSNEQEVTSYVKVKEAIEFATPVKG